MFGSGLVVRQKAVSPASQFLQKPQPMLNGTQTMSPTFIRSTALPISTTSPRFSCPNILPFSKLVRPSYMCRSEPQILVLVIFTSTSVGRSIFASGTSLTLTSRGPLYTTAFTSVLPTLPCAFTTARGISASPQWDIDRILKRSNAQNSSSKASVSLPLSRLSKKRCGDGAQACFPVETSMDESPVGKSPEETRIGL